MIVKISRDGESFWVKDVIKWVSSGCGKKTVFKGIIDNDLAPDNRWKLGDTITFQEDEIIDIYNEEAGKSERDIILEKKEITK